MAHHGRGYADVCEGDSLFLSPSLAEQVPDIVSFCIQLTAPDQRSIRFSSGNAVKYYPVNAFFVSIFDVCRNYLVSISRCRNLVSLNVLDITMKR